MSPTAKQPVTTADIESRVRSAVGAALDRKALDVVVLRVETVCDFTDFFFVCSGSSERQVRAIADAVEETLAVGHGIHPLHVEGLRQGKWVLLDFGDFVVHVFDRDRREFYRLDRLWSDGDDVTEEYVQ